MFKKLQYPLAPMVLAIVLGDRAEASFRQAMLVSQGEMSVFFSNKLVGGMTTLALALLVWPLLTAVWLFALAGRPSWGKPTDSV
jgi:putative tricarboxylic transport membrane protein